MDLFNNPWDELENLAIGGAGARVPGSVLGHPGGPAPPPPQSVASSDYRQGGPAVGSTRRQIRNHRRRQGGVRRSRFRGRRLFQAALLWQQQG